MRKKKGKKSKLNHFKHLKGCQTQRHIFSECGPRRNTNHLHYCRWKECLLEVCLSVVLPMESSYHFLYLNFSKNILEGTVLNSSLCLVLKRVLEKFIKVSHSGHDIHLPSTWLEQPVNIKSCNYRLGAQLIFIINIRMRKNVIWVTATGLLVPDGWLELSKWIC